MVWQVRRLTCWSATVLAEVAAASLCSVCRSSCSLRGQRQQHLAWSSAVQRGQKCSSPTRRLPSRSWGPIRPRVCSWFRAPIRHEGKTAQRKSRGRTVFILRPTNVRIWHKAVFKVGPVALKEMIQQGILEKFTQRGSNWASPIFAIKKRKKKIYVYL